MLFRKDKAAEAEEKLKEFLRLKQEQDELLKMKVLEKKENLRDKVEKKLEKKLGGRTSGSTVDQNTEE